MGLAEALGYGRVYGTDPYGAPSDDAGDDNGDSDESHPPVKPSPWRRVFERVVSVVKRLVGLGG